MARKVRALMQKAVLQLGCVPCVAFVSGCLIPILCVPGS